MDENVHDIPPNLADLTEEGINDAIEALATSEDRARRLADQLDRNPRVVIKRALRMKQYQRGRLMEMTDDEVRELTDPVVEALRGPHAMNFMVHYHERVVRQSPVTVRCEVEVTW